MNRSPVATTAAICLAGAALLSIPACRRPYSQRTPVRNPTPVRTDEAGRTESPRDVTDRDSVPATIAAIIDSIEAAVRDSIAEERASRAAAATRDSLAAAARRDSIEAARRDSILASARRDSIETARRDSTAAAARRDSIAAAARRDSIAAAARRDSLAAAGRRDSIEAAIRDSIVAAARRDSLAEAARLDSIQRARDVNVTDDLAQLRALGPAYIPYDRGPRPVWDTEMQARVTTTLLPVIRAEALEARTRAFFWLLIRADGTVDQAILQTSSGNQAFDEAAARVAAQLLFAPAIRGERAVPTWVVRDISLIMQ